MSVIKLIKTFKEIEKTTSEGLYHRGIKHNITKYFPEKIPSGDPTGIGFKWETDKKDPELESPILVRYCFYGIYCELRIYSYMFDDLPRIKEYISQDLTRKILRFYEKEIKIKTNSDNNI